jgi:hypothetical protein
MTKARTTLMIMSGLCGTLSVAAVLTGCQSQMGRDAGVTELVRAGEYGQARDRVAANSPRSVDDRSYMLSRMRLVTLALADGAGQSVEGDVDLLYDNLRTQGVNADRTLSTFIVGEGSSRIYKGDPFEQAMAYHYVGVFDGLRGDWGSTRAASTNSLFLLRDFSKTLQATGKQGGTTDRRGRAAQRAKPESQEALIAAAAENGGDFDYTTTASDFELGYVMRAIAAMQIQEREDAQEALATLRQIAPRLSGLADQIASGNYNTVLVVDYGSGPEKIATGPSGAIAAHRPLTPSTDQPLTVSAKGSSGTFPVVTDVNRIAQSLKWANLEEMRLAKSFIGDALLIGGTVVAASADDDEAQLAGVAAILAGLIVKATSQADTRQNDALPQRVYVALLNLPVGQHSRVELAVPGSTGGRMVLPYFPGPERTGRAQMRYVRLPGSTPQWAMGGRVLYNSDATGNVIEPNYPYILGGRDVRTPSWEVLRSYHESGYLSEMTSVNDLIDLYKDEGIRLVGINTDQRFGRHILEGGNALYTPDAASAGFVRLYGTERAPYQPRGAKVRAMQEQLRAASTTSPTATASPVE